MLAETSLAAMPAAGSCGAMIRFPRRCVNVVATGHLRGRGKITESFGGCRQPPTMTGLGGTANIEALIYQRRFRSHPAAASATAEGRSARSSTVPHKNGANITATMQDSGDSDGLHCRIVNDQIREYLPKP